MGKKKETVETNDTAEVTETTETAEAVEPVAQAEVEEAVEPIVVEIQVPPLPEVPQPTPLHETGESQEHEAERLESGSTMLEMQRTGASVSYTDNDNIFYIRTNGSKVPFDAASKALKIITLEDTKPNDESIVTLKDELRSMASASGDYTYIDAIVVAEMVTRGVFDSHPAIAKIKR